MNQKQREEILDKMAEISKKVDEKLEKESQTRGNTSFHREFAFEGNRTVEVKNVYIVEILNEKQKEAGDKKENRGSVYEIYDEDGALMAAISEEGKVHFVEEYLDKLRDFDGQLNVDDIEFELPKELGKNDIVLTREELDEHSERKLGEEKAGIKGGDKEDRLDGQKEAKEGEEKQVEQETEEEKKQKTAEALGVNSDEIKAVCTINPQEKITDKHNLIDIMPEAAEYEEVSIACTTANEFVALGVTEEGTREQLNSIEPIEGTTTSKSVISVNEDGSEVTEKQVKGLFRIDSGSNKNGIAVSTGDYGMMNVDYVSNVMDKENRRATPIRTKDVQNQRIVTAKVRENAGDSIPEMEKEGKKFRKEQKEGIDPQSLDGIDTDKADGQGLTLEELKEQIKEKALEKGDMSRGEMEEFIKSEISGSGLELSEEEIAETTEDIREAVLDESRFPSRGDRR